MSDAEGMPPDEHQEIVTYARTWARRFRLLREVLIAEGLSEPLADEITRMYARNYLQPDYSPYYRQQAKLLEKAMAGGLRAGMRPEDE